MMTKTNGEALTARLDVLSLALQEIARALAPAQATQVADAIRMRVTDLTAAPMTATTDEALTGELAPLLSALVSRMQTAHQQGAAALGYNVKTGV